MSRTECLRRRRARRVPRGAQTASRTKSKACAGRAQSYRLQHMPTGPSFRIMSLHRQAKSSSACLLVIRFEKCNPSSVSSSTRSWLKTDGTKTGGGFGCKRRAYRSAFIASTSVCRMVSAREGDSLDWTGSVTGRKKTASAMAKSVLARFSTRLLRLVGNNPGTDTPDPILMSSHGFIKADGGDP